MLRKFKRPVQPTAGEPLLSFEVIPDGVLMRLGHSSKVLDWETAAHFGSWLSLQAVNALTFDEKGLA